MAGIEQAYKTLGLNSGASLRQVDEAYRDLRAIWDPKRFSDNPRLRSQASDKKQEIEGAYETIIEHLSRKSPQKAPDSPVTDQSPARTGAPNPDRPSTNLFDDAFSDRVTQGRRKIPVWAIMFLIVFAGLLLSYFALSPSKERTEAIESTAADDEESELTKVVEEVRGRYTESEASSTPVDTPEEARERVVPPEPKPEPEPVAPKPVPRKTIPEKTRDASPPRQEIVAQKPPQQPEPPPEPETAPEPERSSDKPLLVRDEILGDGGTSEQIDDGPSDEQLEIFKTLLKGSATASKLVRGEIGTLDFAEWSVIQQTPSETWIDLVATWTSGQEVHFFWSVNAGTGGVRPLNQAARNLESSVGAP
jgi:hypothetical protein